LDWNSAKGWEVETVKKTQGKCQGSELYKKAALLKERRHSPAGSAGDLPAPCELQKKIRHVVKKKMGRTQRKNAGDWRGNNGNDIKKGADRGEKGASQILRAKSKRTT